MFFYTYKSFSMEIDDETGALTSLQYGDAVLLKNSSALSMELEFMDAPLLECGFKGIETEHLDEGLRVVVEYKQTRQLESAIAMLRLRDVLDIRDSRLVRRLFVYREDFEPEPLRLSSATLGWEGLSAGRHETISVPMARWMPNTPLSEALKRPQKFTDDRVGEAFRFTASAPDIFPGVICLESAQDGCALTLTALPFQSPVHPAIYGKNDQLVLEHNFECENIITGGDLLLLGEQVLQVTIQNDRTTTAGVWAAALPLVGTLWAERGYSVPEDRPKWARDAVIYEIEPREYPNGLRGITADLQKFEQTGFNTIYLMPWHKGSYGTIDYESIDPKCGTFEDLRALCDAAHSRKLHILFDLLVNIAKEDSPYVKEHPDWFYRQEDGTILRHPSWGGCCFDPASPGFRRFLTDYAVRCCTEWGADGFRVDAVAYRGGNWNPLLGLQPHQHSNAVFTLVGEIRQAIKSANPQAILMAECFGPAQAPVSDLVCYQWISWLDWALERMLSGKIDGTTLQRLLAEQFMTMPPDVWFTGYTQTHDTIAFEKRDQQGPAVDAFFALLALLCSGIMVYAGGWGMRQRPSQEESIEWSELFKVKQHLGRVSGSSIDYPASGKNDITLFTRPSNIGEIKIAVNFSANVNLLPAGTLIYSRLGSEQGVMKPWDVVVLS